MLEQEYSKIRTATSGDVCNDGELSSLNLLLDLNKNQAAPKTESSYVRIYVV